MKFAFLIMGEFAGECAQICGGAARLCGVSSLAEACDAAKRLAEEGVGCIELCGAFGEKGAREIIRATEGRIPVGFVTHLPEQDALYRSIFGG